MLEAVSIGLIYHFPLLLAVQSLKSHYLHESLSVCILEIRPKTETNGEIGSAKMTCRHSGNSQKVGMQQGVMGDIGEHRSGKL